MGLDIAGIPLDFILFAAVLAGVALLHAHTMRVAVAGLVVVSLYKVLFAGFAEGTGLAGLGAHLAHEWVTVANLFCLLLGFALLSRHFEESGIPAALPRWLPDGRAGAFVLLVLVFVISSFLDNIAAAIIGGTIAATVFRGRVHIGYLAGIVAASNAGGSGSVVGDTTTTMIWIAGASPLAVFSAYSAAVVALLIVAWAASGQQHGHSPLQRGDAASATIDWGRAAIVGFILVAAIVVNVVVNTRFAAVSDRFPFIGAAVWAAILLSAPVRRPDWAALPGAVRGTVFLLSLVLIASMMPVERLPDASWQTALGLGFVSAVFDNIPLTALALTQGGYDWGVLAYAVGFGGSMLWFGSSAGVALSNQFPEARSVGAWLRSGWHVALGYVVGFAVMIVLVGWHPTPLGHG
ncbi:MAG: citrate transporter [Burkholderiales bacterium]|jgi:Na+/H+ antiporter NhaD/arsenite permease-like protein